jgi:dolichol-phosphate mannosyltransferase
VTAEVSIVIPVYNEGDGILPVFESLRNSVKSSFEVLICYDRHDDTTLKVLGDPRAAGLAIKTVFNPIPGPHHAVQAGFAQSKSPFILVLPADDTENAPLIDRMVDLGKNGADIVCASRFVKGGRMVGCPWLKAVLVRVANFTLHFVAGLPTHDSTNGFRLFSRRVIDSLAIESERGFTYSLELLVKVHRLGWKISEIPASWTERRVGQSRFKVLNWLPAYLRWYSYAFATTFLRRGSQTVLLKEKSPST